MSTSVATVCLSGTLAEKLRAAADAGFDGVEIFEQDLVVSPHSAEQIRKRAEDLGLTLDLFQPFRDFEGVEETQFEKNLLRLEAKFKLMNRLGIETILLCSNVGTATINDDELFVQQLRRAGDLAARYNVKIAYEALAWGKFVNDFEHAHAIVEKVDHEAVGTCLDTFHILSRGWATDAVENIPAEKIFFVQLADAPKLSMDILSWSRHHRVFPGEGDFDLVKFMVHLARTGYDGPISLEIFNDSFRKAEVGRTAIDGLRSLRWLEDQTWHALKAEERPSALQLRALPEVAEPDGVDFLEIATGRLGETIRVLHQLGFRLGGHHCSKQDYQVWTQGDVRIVVCDRGPTGAATTIAAMGFDTPDPAAAHERAELLKARTIDRSRGVGEADLKGVYAPDGVELYFAGPSPAGMPEWLAEFGVDKQEDNQENRPASLIRSIDHVNLAQPWQHFDEAVLFYTALMALETVREDEFPSPIGLVRNQVMRSPNDAVRLLLSVAPEDGEQGDFLNAAYPEHIALATEDIVAVAQRAKKRGLEFLPVPENYFDDLQTRFDLDETFLAVLQENNLLYDRDEHGEFLHFYTRTLGTLFFEVVERRGGFSGWGETNAPVRLAAQYREVRDLERGIPQ